MLLSSAAHAAGLGKLTVLSALGQPLRAEIELTTTAGEDVSSMAVKLASPEAFRTANIEFNPALLSLRFSVEQRAGRPYIRVSSGQPLNEPFVDMLIELSWNSGRLVREYTFLLDPAELRAAQPAQAALDARPAAPAAPARPAPQAPAAPAASQEARRDTAAPAPRAAAAASAAAATAAQPPSSYRVRRGDTLGKIAARLKPADISLDMMLVALYRANPDAFIGNNMNRLKSGQILAVPATDAMRSGGGEAEARGVVVAHAADFNAYRNKLAGQVANAAPQRTPQAGQSASGRITAKVEEGPTAAREAQDQLRLSKATQAAGGTGGDTASAEDAIARERELAQAQERVKELERNVSELEQMMTVKSRAGSEAQDAAAAGADAGSDAEAAAPAPAKPVKPARPAASAKPKAPAPEEKGLADTLMDNINYVAGGAIVLLLAALGISQRRKKRQEEARPVVAEPSVLGVPGQAAHSLYSETGGQSVDTSNSVFNSSFAPSASQLDTNEVDPVAEADVYIAYGRDAQAEEILKEALRTHPERHPVRLKLLEIYAARKDLRAFEAQASELFGLTRGQGDEWAQAAALGLGIDPSNPLYAGGAGVAPVAPVQSPQERDQQSLLSKQLEDAFRGGAPAVGAAYAMSAADLDDAQDATAVPAQDTAHDDNALDFDLGDLSFEPVGAGEPEQASDSDDTAVPDLDFVLDPVTPADLQEAPAPAPSAEEPFDLAFDMSFADPEAPAGAPPAETPVDAAVDAAAPNTDIDLAGLAAEFDLPPLPAVEEDVVPAAAEDDPLFDLDMMDFGQPATPAAASAVAEATPFHDQMLEQLSPDNAAAPAVPAAADPLFDLDAMDFGDPSSTTAAPAAPAPLAPFEFDAAPAGSALDDPFALPEPSAPAPKDAAFDLADIDLDLPALDMPAAPASGAASEPALEAAALSPELMEMETKLDLALAYQEIGDKEGARELLDEVIKGGNSEQVSKASAMRSLLA
ncbi:LysM peptidoglycan-binding domain-containing protein [Massilia oculi]|uniref:LysM peptidoglycan-binding domain-containing protein n=1 Tax=Massilia hydrophila TaxID=3044279 RepID=A0ABS7Y8W3_9BURK|nr:LysM peptidoglycan-binding domain-containing protein [Massilia oculi]